MDEKSAIAAAAEELFEGQGADEAVVVLRRQAAEQFPVLLFSLNVFKDFFGDPAIDILQGLDLTGVLAVIGVGAYIFYNVCFSLPLWFWNFKYVWGKFTKLQSLGRLALTTDGAQKGARNAAAGGIKFIRKRFKKQIVGRFAIFFIGSLIPILNLLLLQSTLIFFAHQRHNKIAKGILAGFEAFGEFVASGGNAVAAERVAVRYAEQAASDIVRMANASGRAGDQFGERARAAAQRMEGNVTRVARSGAVRAVSRLGAAGQRGSAPQRSGPTSPARVTGASPTPSGRRVA